MIIITESKVYTIYMQKYIDSYINGQMHVPCKYRKLDRQIEIQKDEKLRHIEIKTESKIYKADKQKNKQIDGQINSLIDRWMCR